MELKTIGVYVGEHKDGAKAYFILFDNGLCYITRRSTETFDSLFYSSRIYEEVRFSSKDSPIGWGIFNIENNTIALAFWAVARDTFEYNRVDWKGEILNSKTIVIRSGWGMKDEITFHFHALKHKPDSTNNFIK